MQPSGSNQRRDQPVDIELANIGHQPARVVTRSSERGRQGGTRPGDKGNNKQYVYRDPFGRPRKCKYQHQNCVYHKRLGVCREQLTPVSEVSTPDSSSRGLSSAGTVSSRKSRPGTPMAIPGSAKRISSPGFYSDSDCGYIENEYGLPGYIPESENSVTTVKATATVTLELTSSSSSIPYRVTRLHSQNE